MNDQLLRLDCEVCFKSLSIGVASSVLGPISLAFCQECISNKAEPQWLFIHTLVTTEGHVADWVKELSTYRDGQYIKWDEWVARFGKQEMEGIGL